MCTVRPPAYHVDLLTVHTRALLPTRQRVLAVTVLVFAGAVAGGIVLAAAVIHVATKRFTGTVGEPAVTGYALMDSGDPVRCRCAHVHVLPYDPDDWRFGPWQE